MNKKSQLRNTLWVRTIRAKLCSCSTGQVEEFALANTLSCSVSRSPLSLGLIVSVHLRRGCHASVCSAAPTTMSNWKRGREEHFWFFTVELHSVYKAVFSHNYCFLFVCIAAHSLWWVMCLHKTMNAVRSLTGSALYWTICVLPYHASIHLLRFL